MVMALVRFAGLFTRGSVSTSRSLFHGHHRARPSQRFAESRRNRPVLFPPSSHACTFGGAASCCDGQVQVDVRLFP